MIRQTYKILCGIGIGASAYQAFSTGWLKPYSTSDRILIGSLIGMSCATIYDIVESACIRYDSKNLWEYFKYMTMTGWLSSVIYAVCTGPFEEDGTIANRIAGFIFGVTSIGLATIWIGDIINPPDYTKCD